jgi:hypothetical protein
MSVREGDDPPAMIDITISPARAAVILAIAVAVLTSLHLVAMVLKYFVDDFPLRDAFVDLFSTGREANIPTWYSSFALLLCAALLAVIAAAKKRSRAQFAGHWMALAAIFVYLALDEGSAIHEQAVGLRSPLQVGGILHYSWVIPAGVLVLLFATVYRRFLGALPPLTRRHFLLAGALYVGGALGFELIGGQHAELYGVDNFVHRMITGAEEAVEMAAVVVFIYGLLYYIGSELKSVRVRIAHTR